MSIREVGGMQIAGAGGAWTERLGIGPAAGAMGRTAEPVIDANDYSVRGGVRWQL
jgi:hypothetical protein